MKALMMRHALESAATIAFTVEKLGWLAATVGDARGAALRLGVAAY